MQVPVSEAKSVYFRDFAAASKGSPWLVDLHRRGIERFEASGFPTRRQEAWRKTDLTAVTNEHFVRPEGPGPVDSALSEQASALGDSHRVVLVDGYLDRRLSHVGELPAGVTVAPFSEYAQQAPKRLTDSLGALAEDDSHPFVALNTAFFDEGVFIHAAENAVLERPVVVVHITSAQTDRHGVYGRVLVAAETGAELNVAEHFLGDAAPLALECPVTEIDAGANAHIDYYRLQESGAATFHLGAVHASAARDASVSVQSFTAGARLSRVDIYADLEAPGADVNLNGLYVTQGRQFSDHHTWLRHNSEHGTSRQLFKGVLRGRSETVFDGLVRVAKGAQKTDAQQQNRNLLLDRMALAHSNPRLEIYADDVKCAHGSTVGELDEDAMFYLRSRGVGPADAQAMLTFAFASEMLEPIRLTAVREHIRQLLFRRLPGDDTVRETS